MNTAQPIRNKQALDKFMNYYKKTERNPRNQLLLVMGVNTALRISDLLALRWRDVYEAEKHTFRGHISLVEAKTGKTSCIFVNQSVRSALGDYFQDLTAREGQGVCGLEFLFQGRNGLPISRVQAYRIIRKAAESCQLSGVISPHSLRKTFGYHAWKQGIPPVLLMEIYHHSSFTVTQRYLGIEQDDRDEVFKNICL